MSAEARPAWRFYAGVALRLCALIAVILLAMALAERIKDVLGIEIMPHNETLVHRSLMLGLLGYVVLTAIPFVPGAEIGVTILTLFGASMAPLVYFATVLSLSLSFAMGRLVPCAATARVLRRLRLVRAAAVMERLAALPREARPQMLLDLVDHPAASRLARHRYLTLMLLINLPGNVVIGGGGGIAFAAGLSHVFTPLRFLGAVMIAVLPVPLAVFIMGG